ncbi:hypothetical protein [Ekhidna sp.]|uniref:hypothetical protein n=1 Tax=Ekhidna sp. TaxID=2608089 RepID=UPI0032EDAD6E
MKELKSTIYSAILFMLMLGVAACSGGKKSEEEESGHDHSEMTESEDGHDHGEESSDDHGEASGGHDHGSHGEASMDEGEGKTWTPSGNGEELIRSDFHFIAGAMENIAPEVTEAASDNVLKLTANGTPVAFVFHQSYGNIGMAVSLNASSFQGTYKLIHHASNADNHEFVAVNGNNMKLGRIVQGDEMVFDESEFESDEDWINLRVSAAGTHYKGYIGNKTVTHGHGDKMKNGYVGIMLDGTGKILIKSIETVPLEDE